MDVVNGYFQFLINKVKAQDPTLCWKLYTTEYIYRPELFSDANRASDGMELRYEFTVYAGEGVNNVASDEALEGLYAQPCSVLEMLVALAIRIDTDITGEPGVDNAWVWFQLMIENLGLNMMNADYVLHRFLNREYDEAGNGGLFPLHFPCRDQRTIGIWEQLSDYISEMRERGKL